LLGLAGYNKPIPKAPLQHLNNIYHHKL
jgi:hypothetical protein